MLILWEEEGEGEGGREGRGRGGGREGGERGEGGGRGERGGREVWFKMWKKTKFIQKLTFETMKVWRLNYGNPS